MIGPLFYKAAGCCLANPVKKKPLTVIFQGFYYRNIVVQCITGFYRAPLFTIHFSISAFNCKYIFVSLTYVHLVVQACQWMTCNRTRTRPHTPIFILLMMCMLLSHMILSQIGMLLSHMQNLIWRVNSMPILQQVCSVILL